MYIILDTNIFFKDWLFRKDLSQAFVDYVRKTRAQVILPKIIIEEVRANYRKELENKASEYERACRELNQLRAEPLNFTKLDLDLDYEANSYVYDVLIELGIDEPKGVIGYSAELLEKVANRAIHKRKPFTGNTEREFKDTLIWETVLEIVALAAKSEHGEFTDEGVVFFSSDYKAFSFSKDKPDLLHSELQKDLEAFPNVKFHYYNDFNKFVEAHHSPIAAVTREAVLAHVVASDFLAKFNDDFLINIDEVVDQIERLNPLLEFPNLYNELETNDSSEIRNQTRMFIYLYKNPVRTIVFQRLKVRKLTEITYYNPLVSIETSKVLLKLNFLVDVTIPYENGSFGEVSVDNADLVPGNDLFIRLPRVGPRIVRGRFS